MSTIIIPENARFNELDIKDIKQSISTDSFEKHSLTPKEHEEATKEFQNGND